MHRPPVKLAPRAVRIARVQAALAAAGIVTEIRRFECSTATAQLAADALECTVGQIVKSLILRTADDAPLLVLVGGDARADLRKLAPVVGRPVEKPAADFVRVRTGFEIGGVSPLGHISPEAIPTVMDAGLLEFDTVWAAAGSTRAVFAIAPAELARASQAKIADITA